MQNRPEKIEIDEVESSQKPGVHSFSDSERRFYAHRRGFSLIEILVAVSIIGLLVGIGTAVGVKMTVEARKEQTRAMMESLLAANIEFKAVRKGSSIADNGPVSGVPYTLSSTERFLEECSRIKSCDEIVKAALLSAGKEANNTVYRDGSNPTNGFKSVYDRWGTEIEYRQFNDQTGVGTWNEKGQQIANNLLPLSRDPFFASAGPDEEWGTDDDITTVEQ